MSRRPSEETGGERPARDAAGLAALLLAATLAVGTALAGREGNGPPLPAAPSPPIRPGGVALPIAGAADQGRPRLAKLRPAAGLDLNRADAEALTALPGVGRALARRIVAERASHGPFRSPEDLLRVPGIGWKRLERLRPFLRAGEGA